MSTSATSVEVPFAGSEDLRPGLHATTRARLYSIEPSSTTFKSDVRRVAHCGYQSDRVLSAHAGHDELTVKEMWLPRESFDNLRAAALTAFGGSEYQELSRITRQAIEAQLPGGEPITVPRGTSKSVQPHQVAGEELSRSPGADFKDALKDLDEAHEEAREEGHSPPAELAVRNARRLLRHMYELRPCRYEVYPTRDREMCIYVPEGGRSVLVTCDPDGGVHCSTSLEQGHSRTYYDRDYAADPPPGFLQEALVALDDA